MKELINVAIFIAMAFGGTKIAVQIHDAVRKAAIEKVSQGLPPLPRFKIRN
jgi:uncharacterized protein YfeS